jgi:site-specific recombinase XerD
MRAGPSGPFLDAFSDQLRTAGFSRGSARSYLFDAEHFGFWLARQRIEIRDVDDAAVDRFAGHLRGCRCTGARHTGYRRVPFRVRAFLAHLRRTGVIAAPARSTSPAEQLFEAYSDWMRRRRGVRESTLHRQRCVIRPFLDKAGVDPARYTPAGVRGFVLAHVRAREPSAVNVTRSLRSFLRYLVAQGRCGAELVAATPRVPSPRLASLPRCLGSDEVESTIATCGTGILGLRDRAILLALARLGLRPSDVVRLRLDDIDWRRGRIRVVGKARRETWLPLPQDAGDAILAYLARRSIVTHDDHVFLAVCAPCRPLSTTSVTDCAVKAIKRAGVDPPHRGGAYVFRHSLASRMLRQGATLDLIGAVLRHRGIETTAIYAKVDVGALREIAQPWPITEGPC